MTKNKDLKKRLEAQKNSKKLHEEKKEAYEHQYDKNFAQKTIRNVDAHINKLEKKLGKNFVSGEVKKMEHKSKKKPL